MPGRIHPSVLDANKGELVVCLLSNVSLTGNGHHNTSTTAERHS